MNSRESIVRPSKLKRTLLYIQKFGLLKALRLIVSLKMKKVRIPDLFSDIFSFLFFRRDFRVLRKELWLFKVSFCYCICFTEIRPVDGAGVFFKHGI